MASNGPWLIDESKPLSESNLEQLDRELADAGPDSRSGGGSSALAVCVHDIVIHDNKKWFGEADIRIDALVFTGYGEGADPESFYMPKTATFPRVKDGDRLSIGSGGLLIFYGPAMHFLDMTIMVSRDRKDTDTLASILSGGFKSDEAKTAVTSLVGLTAMAAPQVAAVAGAVQGAAVLGELAFKLLRNATGSTIGLYRNAHLQSRDGFGVGPHPEPPQTAFRANDLSFRYEILEEE